MDSRFQGAVATKARPILNTRDYDNARRRLAEALSEPAWLREDARIDALMVAVTAFEHRFLSREVQAVVEWAECVFMPPLQTSDERKRRWSDLTH
ncbi:MAG TPA: hypothetical protein VFA81_09725 [Burkholderiales bacterium]|nr:hypothetical protein [Burkholderiales bacterium]